MTDKSVTLGVINHANYDRTVSSFASKGQTVGDQKVQAQAVAAYINGHGGIDGRQINLVFHDTDVSSGSFDSQGQAACAAFTEDTKVFAVMNQSYGFEVMSECLASHNTALLAGGDLGGWADQEMLDRHPDFLFMPSTLNFTRLGSFVDSLVDQGFFAKGSRAGLLWLDDGAYSRATARGVRPALSRRGIVLTDDRSVKFANSVSGVSDVAADVANAVLRFRSDGVDRVMFVEGVGLIPFLFMPQAESQNYRPRYGISTDEQPDWLRLNVPAGQLQNSIGAGWKPAIDVPVEAQPPTAARSLCADIYKAVGQDIYVDTFREHAALGLCENFFFLQQAMGRSHSFAAGGLRAGVEALGTSFASPLTPSTRFGPGRHDGATTLRPLAFNDGCGCFRYTAEARDIG